MGREPHGGGGSPICYLKEQPWGSTDLGIFILLQASHYYKYKQQFIFPGESVCAQAPLSKPAEGHEWTKARVIGVSKLKEGGHGTTSPQDHGGTWRRKRRGWGVTRAPWYQGDPEARQKGLRRWSAVEGRARVRRGPEPCGRREVLRGAELGTGRHETKWPHQPKENSGIGGDSEVTSGCFRSEARALAAPLSTVGHFVQGAILQHGRI